MTTLYHYTCDHAVESILRDEHVRSLADLHPHADMPPWGLFAWFTDLDVPDRTGLGLTSTTLSCDRTAHRFVVTDATEVERWVTVRRCHSWAADLEGAPGAMPMHWWLATEAVPVREATS